MRVLTHHVQVCHFSQDKESGGSTTAVGVFHGVLLGRGKEALEVVEVAVVDGVIKGDKNHLRHVSRVKVARDVGSYAATVR